MTKRRKYLLLLAMALVVVGVVIACIPSREPSYGGKRLSGWVDEMPSVYQVQNGWYSVMPNEATKAISAIGTNAIPRLLTLIRYERPAWEIKLLAILNRVFRTNLGERRVYRAHGATTALSILGAKAEGAVPALVLLMNDSKAPSSAFRAKEALVRMMAAQGPNVALSSHALFKLLRDPDLSVRIGATNAIRQIDALRPLFFPGEKRLETTQPFQG